MNASQVTVAAVAVPSHVTTSFVYQARRLSKRDAGLNMPYDFDTIKTCTWWYDNHHSLTCKVRDWMLGISPEDFSRWNPSITLDCGNWEELLYCVVDVETLGCYIDDDTLSNRTTTAGEGGSSSQLTVPTCDAACFADNFQYAGVKAGAECWCGAYVGQSTTPDEAACSIPCGGDVLRPQTKDPLPPITGIQMGGITVSPAPTSTTTKMVTTTGSPEATATPTGSGAINWLHVA